MTILGIETSCDETGAAIIEAASIHRPVYLQTNVLATSLSLHAKTGGIIPENAAREQIKMILPVINESLAGKYSKKDIDAIAVTIGPGLIGSLLVGVETAKTLAYLWDKPLIPVNHLYGHIYANWIIENKNNSDKPFAISHLPFSQIEFPALALVVSGGHTDLVLMESHEQVNVIGSTRDDAAGEAFDKIGRLLNLSYPAGPKISQLAKKGNDHAFDFPRPMMHSQDYDFSFSGLKTAVFHAIKKIEEFDDQIRADICASVEKAIVDVLVNKTIKAAKEYQVKSILLGGGVAANDKLREQLKLSAISHKLTAEIFIPQKSLCTDNAAMIAAAAFYRNKSVSWKNITADPELYY